MFFRTSKFLYFIFVLCCSFLSLEAQEQGIVPPLYKETEHFRLYCFEGDQTASNRVLDVLERNQERIARDFKEELKEKIVVEVHPKGLSKNKCCILRPLWRSVFE